MQAIPSAVRQTSHHSRLLWRPSRKPQRSVVFLTPRGSCQVLRIQPLPITGPWTGELNDLRAPSFPSSSLLLERNDYLETLPRHEHRR